MNALYVCVLGLVFQGYRGAIKKTSLLNTYRHTQTHTNCTAPHLPSSHSSCTVALSLLCSWDLRSAYLGSYRGAPEAERALRAHTQEVLSASVKDPCSNGFISDLAQHLYMQLLLSFLTNKHNMPHWHGRSASYCHYAILSLICSYGQATPSYHPLPGEVGQ